jgi:hypothetical protein
VSDDGLIEGVESESHTWVVGVQWHPERDEGAKPAAYDEARVEIADGNDEGVMVSHGSGSGGYPLFVKDHKLHHVHNYVGVDEYGVVSESQVPDGLHEVAVDFQPTGSANPGQGRGTPAKAQRSSMGNRLVKETCPLPCHWPSAWAAA